MATGLGTGLTVGFGTSSFTAEILSVNAVDISRERVRSSHMGTTANHTHVAADLSDPGGCDVECFYDYDQQPPIDAVAETITITFPKRAAETTAANIAGTGFITGWSWGAAIDEMMTGSFTLHWSDIPTYTDAV